MTDMAAYIVGSTRPYVPGRTPAEHRIVVQFLRDNAEEWFVYSLHMNMGSAHNRASRLRGGSPPAEFVPFLDRLQFKACRHPVHGPVVQVRWHVTEDTAQVSP